ncbi:hypothetical protein F511_24441 [Dorcoceras hygrometricum]|uniref:Uncharacterized protein n=1 Tax=Dorcoceras hygrometricum TaxID=472368 RepID=A0A2Z7CPM4_9LAMI|nr:hypothetical protein F511_24441 [Dorcoceras hygrometricum]
MLCNRLRGTAARGGRKSLAMASPSSRIHAMSIDYPWRNNCARLLAHWPASARPSCATIVRPHALLRAHVGAAA